MSLSLLLFETFGPTLGRVLFGLAFKDVLDPQALRQKLGDDFVKQMLKEITSNNPRASKKGARFFEQIGETAAESLEPVFQKYGSEFATARQEVIAQALADTLSQHALPLLLEANIQQEPFTHKLLALPHPRTLEEAEATLYQKALRQTAVVIFELTPELPHFTRETAAEQLQRLDDIQRKLDEVLANVANIYRTSHDNQRNENYAAYEDEYRRTLSRLLDKLTLFGLLSVNDYHQPLSVAYVNLRMVVKQRSEADPEGVTGRLASREERVLPGPQALQQHNRLLIVGRAGAGKTTLLKWAAVHAARQSFQPDEPQTWAHKIPFFVRLRDYAARPLPNVDELPLAYPKLAEVLGKAPEGWARSCLQHGQALLLLDGLDEVTQAKREAAYEWLAGLQALYPQAVYLVTTRPSTMNNGLTQSRFDQMGFQRFDLQPLDDKGIEQFTANWHAAMGAEQSLLPPEEKALLDRRRQSLGQALQNGSKLRELATNPLLCAMLCALNLARRGQLPHNRVELYEDCLKVLLEKRDSERGVDLTMYGQVPTLPLADKTRYVSELAYWLMVNNQATIPVDLAQAKLAQLNAPEQTLAYLLERTGLIQAQTVEEFDFAHRTFQEFLAAQAILYAGDIPFICERVWQPEWRETLYLTAGQAQTQWAQKMLLEGLWAEAKRAEEKAEVGEEKAFKSLAEAQRFVHLCAWECYDLMPSPDGGVTEWMRKHMVALGEYHAVDTVLAKGKINPEHEHEDEDELVRLFVRLLSQQGLFLRASQVLNLQHLSFLFELQWLVLDNTAVADFSPLQALTQLQMLWLNDTTVADFSPLQALTQLQMLWLNDTAVADLFSLQKLTQLQVLSFDNTAVADLSPLQPLSQLQALSFDNTAVADLSPLQKLSQLRELILNNTAVTHLSPLQKLTHLREIQLNNTAVADLSSLQSLTQLERLWLDNTTVVDLSSLQGLTKLQQLRLNNTAVADLSSLQGLTKLQQLRLNNTAVVDLSPLQNLTQLRELYLNNTAVVDLSPLQNLTQLQYLWLHNTAVADLTPLQGLTQLRLLSLDNTAVADLSPLQGLTQLRELLLNNTNVADLSPIQHLIDNRLRVIGFNSPT